MGYVTTNEWRNNSYSQIVIIKIPEILLFKPEEIDNDEGWFGDMRLPESIERRKCVLESLLDMIKNEVP
jgi:hypothetical protein